MRGLKKAYSWHRSSHCHHNHMSCAAGLPWGYLPMAKACPRTTHGVDEGVHMILHAEERRWPS